MEVFVSTFLLNLKALINFTMVKCIDYVNFVKLAEAFCKLDKPVENRLSPSEKRCLRKYIAWLSNGFDVTEGKNIVPDMIKWRHQIYRTKP